MKVKTGHRIYRPILVAGLVILAAGCGSSEEASRSGPGSSGPPLGNASSLAVSSTLEGQQTLPHRIRWVAEPTAPEDDVSEVEFIIDGEVAFVEEMPPYTYGRDGGYLVTSFLTPGEHAFTVRVTTFDGGSAESTVEAAVEAPGAPPDGLDGMSLSRTMTERDREKATSSDPPPAGRWGLTIDAVGWMVHDPDGGGLLFDVDYRQGGKVELRHSIEQPPYPSPLGGAFCEEPDPPVLWAYTIGDGGKSLTLRPLGNESCGDRLAILEGTWSARGS